MLSGVGIYEGVRVEGVDVEGGRVTGVRTNKGNISCEIFVNCAGQVRYCIKFLLISPGPFPAIQHCMLK